jgi:hypothetical protein
MDQISSSGVSEEILKSGFWSFSPALRSLERVFRYHHAAANPPASAETDATTPSLIQLGWGCSGWLECADFKSFIILFRDKKTGYYDGMADSTALLIGCKTESKDDL